MATMSLRIPESLHRGIKDLATKDGYSMNQFIISAAAEKLASLATVDYLKDRASKADLGEVDRILELIPDVEPDKNDHLP